MTLTPRQTKGSQLSITEMDAVFNGLDGRLGALETAPVQALAALTPAAGKLVYYTSSTVAALCDLTSVGRNLLAASTAAAALTVLGAAPAASPTFTGGVSVTGTSDTPQLTVKGNATQTGPILQVLKSDNTVLMSVDNAGSLLVYNNLTAYGTTHSFGANGAAGCSINYNSATGTNRCFQFLTAGVQRWWVGMNSAVESGTNNSNGGQFCIVAYNDAGLIDTPFWIDRQAGGSISMARPTSITDATVSTTPTTGALVVTGGVGIGGNTYTSGNIACTGNISSGGYVYAPAYLYGAGSIAAYFGDGTSGATVVFLRSKTGYSAQMLFQTGTASRWSFYKDGSTESGGNTGSGVGLAAMADDGSTIIDTPLSIVRAAGGAITLARPVGITGDLTLSDAKNIVLGTTTGTKIGTAITQKIGLYGVTPITQRAGAAQVAVVTTASTQTTPWGFSTQAQADSIVTLVNELRAWAVAFGAIKGAA